MKKIAVLLIMLGIICCVSGCWNRTEVNDIAIVTAIGIDKIQSNNIRLSIQVGIPRNLGPAGTSSGKGGSTLIISETGKTISEAYSLLQQKISRRIFFSHCRILIIGESAAKDGVSHIIDFFARYHEPRLQSYILFTKGESLKLLNTKSELELLSAEKTRELIKQGVSLRISVKEFWDMILTEGIEPLAPQLQLTPKNKTKSGDINSSSTKTQAIVGAAVLKKDKLVGWMNQAETRGILYFRNQQPTSVITIGIPKKMGGGNISVKILSSKTELKPRMQNTVVTMDVYNRTKTIVLENDSKIILNNTKTLHFIQEKLEEEIKNRIELAVHKAQKKFKSDIFGFGKATFQKYPKRKYDFQSRWEKIFPELEVRVKSDVIIRQTGLIQ